MAKPPLGNSRLRFDESIAVDDHIQASCWLNIDDPDLEKSLKDYWRANGNTPSIQLQKKTGDRESHKIATIRFFNEDKAPASAESSGFGRL